MHIKPVFALLALAAVVVAPVAFAGPDLLADTAAGSAWVEAQDLAVDNAHCSRWYGVVSTCTIKFHERGSEQITPELHYFVNGSWAHEHAVLLRSKSSPTTISTTQAIRDLAARQATMGVWVLVWFSLLAVAAIAALRKRRADHEPALSLSPLANDAAFRTGVARDVPASAGPSFPTSPRPFGRRGR